MLSLCAPAIQYLANVLGRFQREDGQDAIEYGAVALIVVVAILGVQAIFSSSISSAVSTAFADIVTQMSNF
jgi:Flp pilus assembly pilin Flp